MAKYYNQVPRIYSEDDWVLAETCGYPQYKGFRVYDGEPLKDNEELYCPDCLEEISAYGCGDESFDHCSFCEMDMEGQTQLVLDQQELEYLMNKEFSAG